MINPRLDLYAHLVLSAQKDRSLNKIFKSRSVLPTVTSARPIQEFKPLIKNKIEKTIDEKVSHIPLHYPLKPVFTKTKIVEKIDEKVKRIIDDPLILELRNDLENAELLLIKIKSTDKHNPKIPILQSTILRLKMLLEQKSYV